MGSVTQPLFGDFPQPVRRRAAGCVRYRELLPQPEGQSAQWWCAEMLAAADVDRKDYCRFMMVAALRALDHTKKGH